MEKSSALSTEAASSSSCQPTNISERRSLTPETEVAAPPPGEPGQVRPRPIPRLLRYDLAILLNSARVTFARWQDRLLAAVMLAAAVLAFRSWLGVQPWAFAAWTALVGATILAYGAWRRVQTQLAFHGSDGLLAADALNPGECGRYTASWHGIGLVLVALGTMLLRPTLMAASIAGYLAGALAALLARHFRTSRFVSRGRPGWSMLEWSNRPLIGLAAAAILLLALAIARNSHTTVQVALAGMGTILFALALSRVDDRTVRFMVIAGHGTGHIVLRHAKGLAAFLAVAVPGSLALGLKVMAVVAALSSTLLVLLVLRILAYRLHPRRAADLLVSLLAGLLVMAAYWAPPALPLAACAVLWHLARSGREKTWLIA